MRPIFSSFSWRKWCLCSLSFSRVFCMITTYKDYDLFVIYYFYLFILLFILSKRGLWLISLEWDSWMEKDLVFSLRTNFYIAILYIYRLYHMYWMHSNSPKTFKNNGIVVGILHRGLIMDILLFLNVIIIHHS